MADKFSDAAAAALDKLTNLAEKYGSEVTDAALLAVRVNGVHELVLATVGGTMAAAIGYAAYRCGKKAAAVLKDNPYGSGEIPYFFGAAGLGLVSAMAGLINGIALFNVWNWVAIFEPKLWIAKRLMGI